MSMIQSARINGHDSYAYLKDVLTRPPTQRASEIEQLLPINGRLPDLRKVCSPFAYTARCVMGRSLQVSNGVFTAAYGHPASLSQFIARWRLRYQESQG
jgi:hypothetical protein